MADETLTAKVLAACDAALDHLDGAAAEAIDRVRTRLQEPLRVAVAGGVSAGKSTLVNALLGQHIAPVDAGECTKVVTWFKYDHHERAEIIFRDRRDPQVMRLESGGTLPDELGVPTADIQRLDVKLSNGRLESFTLIDTPGLNTVTAGNEEATTALLGIDSDGDDGIAIAEADALILLMPYARESDAAVLEAFRKLSEGSRISAVNAVAVLSKVDRLVKPGEDPWPDALEIASRIRTHLGACVSAVIPVVGLLAAAAAGDQLTEADAGHLETLAALDELAREDLLVSASEFCDSTGTTVPSSERERLLDLLGLHGVALAFQAIDKGKAGAFELCGELLGASGFDKLLEVIDSVFARRAELIKCHAALADIDRISYTSSEAKGAFDVRRLIEALRVDPALHDLVVLSITTRVADGSVTLPPALLADVEALARGGEVHERLGKSARTKPETLMREAAKRAVRWGEWANDPDRSPNERRLASDAKAAFELCWDTLNERMSAGDA